MGCAAMAFGIAPASQASHAAECRPFPQHTRYTKGTLKPSIPGFDNAVIAFYRSWKARYLRPAAPGELYVLAVLSDGEKTAHPPRPRSVSEGHGYGMIAAVLMAGADPQAHADFDALYRFFRAHPTSASRDLMAWQQTAKGDPKILAEGEDDKDSATDGDLDIAYALLLADRQWGSGGAIHYKEEALKMLAAILKGETDPARHTLTLGNWAGQTPGSRYDGSLRSSDFMPGHLKAFARASGDPRWSAIVDHTYALFEEVAASFSPHTGLLPDFIVLKNGKYAPAPPRFLESKHDGAYAYNACRVPWRLGVDYLISGDPRALALLKPLNAWVQKATGGDPARINAGYRLDGKPLASDRSDAFTGPFAVAAMLGPGGQPWLDRLCATLLDRPLDDEDYYGNTIKLLTLIVLSGNGWDY